MKDWIETIQEYIDYYGSPHKLNDDSGYSEMPELDPSTYGHRSSFNSPCF